MRASRTVAPGGIQALTLGPDHLMHPTLCRQPFTAAGWLFEHKLDGFRALIRRQAARVELLSRRGRSLAPNFPEAMRALQALQVDAVLDAELVVSDPRGHPAFERLRRRAVMKRPPWIADAARQEPAVLCVFDVLAIDGQDVRDWPLLERKRALVEIVPDAPGLHLVSYVEAHGLALYAAAVDLGLEGIVAKQAASPYLPGRQHTWRKVKNPDYYRQEALGWGA